MPWWGGIYLLLDGILEVTWALFDAPENRGMIATFGVVSAIAGVILIRHPTRAVVAIALLLGLWLLVAGLIRLIRGFADPERRLWPLLLAALELLAGIVIVASPHIGVKTLALLVGISWVLRGLVAISLGILVRAVSRRLTADPTR